jgi:hypothetical protein
VRESVGVSIVSRRKCAIDTWGGYGHTGCTIYVSKRSNEWFPVETYRLAYPPSHRPMIPILQLVSVDSTSLSGNQCALTVVSHEGLEGHLRLLLLFGRYIVYRQQPCSQSELMSFFLHACLLVQGRSNAYP